MEVTEREGRTAKMMSQTNLKKGKAGLKAVAQTTVQGRRPQKGGFQEEMRKEKKEKKGRGRNQTRRKWFHKAPGKVIRGEQRGRGKGKNPEKRRRRGEKRVGGKPVLEKKDCTHGTIKTSGRKGQTRTMNKGLGM